MVRSAGMNVTSSTTAAAIRRRTTGRKLAIEVTPKSASEAKPSVAVEPGGDHHRTDLDGRLDHGRGIVAEPDDLLDVALEHLRRVGAATAISRIGTANSTCRWGCRRGP
jgi:hypothetical protein